MFCGWRIFNSYYDLVKLNSGRLSIDVLTGDCFFNDTPVNQLSIAIELREWFKSDCQTNNIPLNQILAAQLVVDLQFSKINWKDRMPISETFFIDGHPYSTEEFHRCVMKCEGIIKTDEKEYKSDYTRTNEWPIGWSGDMEYRNKRILGEIREKLAKYPDIKYQEIRNALVIPPKDENGFQVEIHVRNTGFTVYAKGWHEECDDDNEAFKYLILCLSDKSRLKVFCKGNFEHKWTLEYKKGDEWLADLTTGLLFYPFWRKENISYFYNNWITDEIGDISNE